MERIKTKNLKYATKELNSSVSVFLDLTEPKRNETKLPKYRNLPKQFCFGRPLVGVPISNDQIPNMLRAEAHGYAKMLDLQTMTKEDVVVPWCEGSIKKRWKGQVVGIKEDHGL